MTSSRASNIVELRQLLAEKFPGVRMQAGKPESIARRWPTGLRQFDELLEGGLAKSALTEIVTSGAGAGSSIFIQALIRRAHENGEWFALVDGADSFDAAALENEVLKRFLWARCCSVKEAVKAADILLHDGTVPVLALDLVWSAPVQLRKTPSSTWFRLQRLAEACSTACVIFTPEPMIAHAGNRLVLPAHLSLDALEEPRETLLARLQPQVLEAGYAAQPMIKIA